MRRSLPARRTHAFWQMFHGSTWMNFPCAAVPPRRWSPCDVCDERLQKQNGRALEEPGRCELLRSSVLEALLQADVPEPAFDVSNRLVVTILERACHKRGILVEHVLHAERDGCVVKPPLPVAAAILRRGDWNDVFLLAVFHLHVLPTILGKARHFGRRRRRQVKRVV